MVEDIEAITAALAIKWRLSESFSEHVTNRCAALKGAVLSTLGAERLYAPIGSAGMTGI